MKKINEMNSLRTSKMQDYDIGPNTGYCQANIGQSNVNNLLKNSSVSGVLDFKLDIHNTMKNSKIVNNTIGRNNNNFTFHKFMKQLSSYIKIASFFIQMLLSRLFLLVRRVGQWRDIKLHNLSFANLSIALAIFFAFATGATYATDVDLAVKQKVNSSIPSIGQSIKYTVWLVNQGNTPATNIVVEDVVPIGGLGSVATTQTGGSWAFNSGSGIGTWTVPALAGGDSVKLEITGTVNGSGVFFNTAQIKASPDTDIDSVPGNSDLTEDDITTSCFSVPIDWYSGDEYTVQIPAPYSYGTGIVWFRNNLAITSSTAQAVVNSDKSLTIKAPGSYTFTTSTTTCSATGCCPIIIQMGPVAELASLGNFVWNDANHDGIQDPTELGIGGVLVTLQKPDGTFVSSTTTDVNGHYLFSGLTPGSYVVVFGKPSGFTSSPINSGLNDATDSDADVTTGKTGTITLVAGENNLTVDAGFYLQGCADIITISALDSDICSGDSTYLAATTSNGANVNWYLVPNGGSPLFTTNNGQKHLIFPTTTTVYYAQLNTIASGCPTERDAVSVVVNARPSNPSCGNIIEVCSGGKVNLLAHIINGITTPGGTFEWHTNASPSSPLVSNPSSVGLGKYYLFEKSGAGCYSNPTVATVVEKPCDKLIDLSLLKTANMRTVNVNDNVIYTVQVTNAGPDIATNVKIVDNLPSGLAFVSSPNFTNVSGVLSTTIASINPGQTVNLTYTIKAIGAGNVINVAEVMSADQKDSDSTPGNGGALNEDDDDDEVITIITPNAIADLSVQKLVNISNPTAGSNVIYTVRVSNAGPNTATNVEITDILPSGLNYLASSGSDQITVTGSTIKAKFNSILSGNFEDILITATVTGSGSITNRAEVTKSDQADPDSSPNSGANEDDDDTVTITVQQLCNPTTPLISCTNPYICSGESVSVSAIGCNGTVLWSNGMTGNIITVSPNVTTVYNARCQVGTCLSTTSNNIQIIVNSIASPTISASSNSVCLGGSVILTATGCTGTVTWSNGVLGSSIEVIPSLPSTKYTATCRILTCVSNPSNPVVITLGNNPTAPVLATTNGNICLGQTATLTATGCTGVVNWSNGQTGSTITVSPLITTSYSATCSNGSCVSLASNALIINVGTSQTPSILASNVNTCGGEPVSMTVNNCTGSILWSNGATTATIAVTPSSTTTYSVTCGTGTCAATATKTITVGGLGMTPTLATSANNVCEGTSITLSASNCSGTINWALTSSPTVSIGTGNSITVTPSDTTSYTATCSTGTGCKGYASIVIYTTTRPAAPIVTCGAERICSGDTLVFTAHYCNGTVNWSNGATGAVMTVTPMATTTYTATCTVNGCVSPSSVPALITVITQTPTITASSETVCTGGSVTLTASNCSGTLLWNTGATSVSINASPTVATTYTVICTVEGCAGKASKTINVGTGQVPVLTASANNVCAGTTVTLTASNCSSSLLWNTGATTSSINVTSSSTTTYTATCGTASCAGSANITVNVTPAQTPTISTPNAFLCVGQSTTLTAGGCSGALAWNTGATTAAITVNPTATSTYTVTCGTGSCARTMSQEIIVTSQSTPTIAASKTTICNGESVTLTASNCPSGLVWSTGATTSTITVSPVINTTYSATCGTGNCAGSSSISIVVGSGQQPTLAVTKAVICVGENTTITASNCSSSILWNTGATTASITVSPTTTTTYTATCGTGTCAASRSIDIGVNSGQTPTITASKTNICGGDSVILKGSNCSSNLLWSNGATSSSITVYPSLTTTYTLTCGTGNCSGTSSVKIEVNGNIAPPSIVSNTNSLCQPGSVTLTATGCNGTVNWSNGLSGNSVNVNITTNNSFTATCTVGTCVSGISNKVTITIGSPTAPSITSSGTVACNGSSIVLTAANCSGTILWSNGNTGSVITVNPVVTTTYSAICRNNSQNCDSPSSNNIIVQTIERPEAPVITCSASRICVGETLLLSAIGCQGTVTWNFDKTSTTGSSLKINPVVTTVYTATCTVGNCTSASSGATTITVGNPIPPTVTCKNTVICNGSTTTIEASGCVGIVKWSNGMTGAVISVSPTTLTTYFATCDGGLCQSSQSNSISVVVSGSGVKTPTIKDIVNVCPNKTVDLTTAVTSQAATGGTFVFRIGNSPTSTAVSSPSLIATSGAYYVFESNGNGCYSEGAKINVGIISCTDSIPNCTTSPATASISGGNQTLCLSNDYIDLIGAIGGSATSAKWTTSGTGTFENSIAPITKYLFSAQDVVTGSVTLTLTTNDPDNGGSCQAASATKVITINGVTSIPTITTSKSPIICLGDSVKLSASVNGSNTYLWSNGATTKDIVVKTPGTYSVKYVNATGCKSLSSGATAVNISNSIAAPKVTSQVSNTCPATTVNLVSKVTSNPVTTNGEFEFHVANDIHSSILANTNAIGAGTYFVFEKSNTGCYSNSSAITVAIDNCNVSQGDADIQVNISGNKTNVTIGDEVIYTLQVKNNGPSNATNILIENKLPEGLLLVGSTPGLLLDGTKLSTTIPAISVGSTVTYTYTAKLTKGGLIVNPISKVSAAQNDPINSNNYDEFSIECKTCQETCIATALKADTLKQANGSYNIKFTALLKNCGNVALTGVELNENLSGMFTSPAVYTIVQKPTPKSGSTLVGNDSFNGSTDIAVLNKLTSTLAVGKIDTVVFVVNLTPMGTEGPFTTNSIAKGVGMTNFGIAQDVSDVSNDGTVIVKALADPTVVKLFKSPSIAIVLAVKDTVKQANGTYNVKFQAIVKNNGSLDLNNTLVSDTLSKYFKTPASYTMVGLPTVNTGSGLVINPAFNGSTVASLTLPTSTLVIGKIDTLLYTINLDRGGLNAFENQAIAQGTGTLANGTNSTVIDISNSGFDPNVPGSSPTQLIFGSQNQGSVINTCIGAALTTINKIKQTDGTYNVTYQAIIKNCGNLTLTNVSICDTLSNTFSSPTEVKVVVKPYVSVSSLLVPDTTFNGISKTCLLKPENSSLLSSEVDTLRWTINVKLNSNNGPFRNNITVASTSPSGQVVTDISNDGTNPAPEGSNPTILNFNSNIPDELIGLAKNLVGITKVEGKKNVFDVEFSFVIKNYGIVPFTKVQLQDNLAYTFGDKVQIDSVIIKDVETGLVVNSNFTGKGQLTYMLNDSLSSLPLNTSKKIGMIVRVDMNAADTLVYENIALAIGTYTGGLTKSDASTTGLNPDANLSGNPLDDSEPTKIDFTGMLNLTPITPLGIAKSVDSLSSADGSYLLTYKVVVKNYGTSKLDSIQLLDNLAEVFSNKTQFVMIGAPTVNTGSTLKINPNFDGDSTKTLLIANQSSLAAGKSDTMTFKVKISNNAGVAQTYLNSINGTAKVGTTIVSDKSNTGLVPDKNNDGNPGNDSEATAIKINPAGNDTSAIKVIITNGLSPNGDSKNDVLVIKDKNDLVTLTEADNISLMIYNRWGHLIYSSDNYIKDSESGKGWSGGSNKGLILDSNAYVPDGTYYYVVSSTNTRLFGGKPVVNFITVKR